MGASNSSLATFAITSADDSRTAAVEQLVENQTAIVSILTRQLESCQTSGSNVETLEKAFVYVLESFLPLQHLRLLSLS